jgi:hypothetical protein
VDCLEAPLIAALDWDQIARKDLYDLSSMFSLMLSLYDLQGYVDLIYISCCFAYHILDLGSLLFVFVGFLYFICCETLHSRGSKNCSDSQDINYIGSC